MAILNNQMVMLIYWDILYSQQDDVGVSENGLCTQNLRCCAYDVRTQAVPLLHHKFADVCVRFPCAVNPMPSISPISGKNGDGTLLLIVKARHILLYIYIFNYDYHFHHHSSSDWVGHTAFGSSLLTFCSLWRQDENCIKTKEPKFPKRHMGQLYPLVICYSLLLKMAHL